MRQWMRKEFPPWYSIQRQTIMKQDVEKYFIPPEEQEDKDDTETVTSTSMADYDCDEAEASLTTIADAFHKIGNEYEHLCSIVLHMSKTQASNVIGRLPIVLFLGKNVPIKKKTKMEPGKFEPAATTTVMVTTSTQMTTVMTEQQRTEVRTTPKAPPVVKLDTVLEEEVNIEEDNHASSKTREAGIEMEESETRPERRNS